MIVYENNLIKIEVENSSIPWLKIFAKKECKEFSECDSKTKAEIWRVLDVIEKKMLEFYKPTKINIASFGNYLPKVHFHIMARFKKDSHFPEPMWGKKQRDGELGILKLDDFLKVLNEVL